MESIPICAFSFSTATLNGYMIFWMNSRYVGKVEVFGDVGYRGGVGDDVGGHLHPVDNEGDVVLAVVGARGSAVMAGYIELVLSIFR